MRSLFCSTQRSAVFCSVPFDNLTFLSFTSLSDVSAPAPVLPPATTALSRTWAAAFADGEAPTGAPEGTLCFSPTLAKKLLVAATGTGAAAKDVNTVHVLRLMGGNNEEDLKEWERLMSGFAERQQRREEAKREKEEKERLEKLEKMEQEKATLLAKWDAKDENLRAVAESQGLHTRAEFEDFIDKEMEEAMTDN